jgi:hypothetical protein
MNQDCTYLCDEITFTDDELKKWPESSFLEEIRKLLNDKIKEHRLRSMKMNELIDEYL